MNINAGNQQTQSYCGFSLYCLTLTLVSYDHQTSPAVDSCAFLQTLTLVLCRQCVSEVMLTWFGNTAERNVVSLGQS